ncbi:MAG: hypothetical protein GXO43_00085 [Crenarchaeota archaeon]|nr:hypothetical protein [Thermoproteota archaeon]
MTSRTILITIFFFLITLINLLFIETLYCYISTNNININIKGKVRITYYDKYYNIIDNITYNNNILIIRNINNNVYIKLYNSKNIILNVVVNETGAYAENYRVGDIFPIFLRKPAVNAPLCPVLGDETYAGVPVAIKKEFVNYKYYRLTVIGPESKVSKAIGYDYGLALTIQGVRLWSGNGDVYNVYGVYLRGVPVEVAFYAASSWLSSETPQEAVHAFILFKAAPEDAVRIGGYPRLLLWPEIVVVSLVGGVVGAVVASRRG